MSNSKVLITRQGVQSDIVVVQVHGPLDTVAAYTFQGKMEELLKIGVYKYILDFRHLEYISSAGIEVFFSMNPELQEHHGGIVFIHVPEKIYKLFKMIGLTTVFIIKDTLESAIKEFEPDEQ